MNTEIKEATIQDIENGLLEVYIQGYRFHQEKRDDIFLELSEETLKRDLINYFESLPILVFKKNGKIIGYLAYKIKTSQTKRTKKLEVDQLVILSEYRGQGVGNNLMNEVKKIAIKNNCSRIELSCWLFNEKAQKMYEHIGFEKQRIIYELNL